jgi:hemerythrin superfamily protein
MFSPRNLTPIARAAFRPQALRVTATSRLSPVRAASTISETITSDHREIEKAYNEVINTDDVDHQARYGNQFTWELARHSVAEELLVYPAMEKYLGEKGKQHAARDREQHHQVCKPVVIFEAHANVTRSRSSSKNSRT